MIAIAGSWILIPTQEEVLITTAHRPLSISYGAAHMLIFHQCSYTSHESNENIIKSLKNGSKGQIIMGALLSTKVIVWITNT